MDNITANEKLSAGLISLYQTAPFYYYVLSGLEKYPNKACPTIGVKLDKNCKLSRIQLVYNPEFILGLTNTQINAILQHEALHIILKHLIRYTENYDARLSNISMDILVNHNILDFKELMGSMYKNSCIIENFESLKGLDLDKSTWEGIYKILYDKAEKKECKSFDIHEWKNASPDASEKSKSMESIAIDAAVKDAIEKLRGQDAGNISGQVRRMIKELTEVKFNWRNYINMFCQSIVTDSKISTWRKINRRLPLIVPGNRKEFQSNLLIVLDNSGSTSNVYQEFIEHICCISKTMNVDAIGCDTQVNFEYTFKDGKPPKDFMDNSSGGGTIFQPAFDYAKSKKKYNGIIYLTDGYNYDDSKLNTFRIPTLFAICEGGKKLEGYRNIFITAKDK